MFFKQSSSTASSVTSEPIKGSRVYAGCMEASPCAEPRTGQSFISMSLKWPAHLFKNVCQKAWGMVASTAPAPDSAASSSSSTSSSQPSNPATDNILSTPNTTTSPKPWFESGVSVFVRCIRPDSRESADAFDNNTLDSSSPPSGSSKNSSYADKNFSGDARECLSLRRSISSLSVSSDSYSTFESEEYMEYNNVAVIDDDAYEYLASRLSGPGTATAPAPSTSAVDYGEPAFCGEEEICNDVLQRSLEAARRRAAENDIFVETITYNCLDTARQLAMLARATARSVAGIEALL